MLRQTAFMLTTALAGCQNDSPATARSRVVEPAKSSALAPRSLPSQFDAPVPAASKAWNWDFEKDSAGQPPAGFSFRRTGSGTLGNWVIVREQGDLVLGQLDADATSFRFPVAVADHPQLRDVRVSVRCKAVSGKVDQACGLVARYRDENNYYVTRANTLEGNVRLYTVKAGKRRQIADHAGAVSANTWHELRLELRGDRLQVYWDGERVIEQRDATFPDAGRAGVWTKADAVTYFDDLTVEGL